MHILVQISERKSVTTLYISPLGRRSELTLNAAETLESIDTTLYK